MDRLEQEVRRTIRLALEEDRSHRDITSQACIPPNYKTKATFHLKQRSKIAGLCFLPWICEMTDPALQCQLLAEDGKNYEKGMTLAVLDGPAHSILAMERTTLNLLQHASGIAEMTSQYVAAVEGTACDVLDTRKTLPGLRAIQKYAVLTGGGKNHRYHLEERFLIKNNHLKLLDANSTRPIADAIRRARAFNPLVKIEVEVENLSGLEEALEEKPDIVMLDNMSSSLVAQAVTLAGGRTYLEASGGITLKNIRDYAASGVNGISIGALTHSVSAIDISLKV
jgi:nicotinate-nucleotide pyrophosphorylase (carboxylating)